MLYDVCLALLGLILPGMEGDHSRGVESQALHPFAWASLKSPAGGDHGGREYLLVGTSNTIMP